jgi:uncharacterized phage protein gp47/JayE
VSLAIPTTAELNATIVSQLEGALAQTIPLLPKSFARVLAKVLAAVFVLLFRYAGFVFLQLFVAHATMDETTINGKKVRPLVELGRLFGVGDPQDATRAEVNVTVTVLNQSGTLKAGTKLLRAETGVLYDVVAETALSAATVTVKIRASGDGDGNGGVGDIGNLQPGDVVSFASPPPSVATDATVLAQVVTAADAESTDNYRRRLLQRVQRRPQGGAYADYQSWGEEVEGIVAIYPYAGELPGGSGPGIVDIYVEADEASSGSPDGIPTAPQLAAVLASINMDVGGKASRRPVNAAPMVMPITRVGFSFVISGLSPNTLELQNAISEGLDEYLRSREPYIVGLSTLPRNDRITEAATSGIVDGIVSAYGATVTLVEMTPGPAYTLEHGEKAKLGTFPLFP